MDAEGRQLEAQIGERARRLEDDLNLVRRTRRFHTAAFVQKYGDSNAELIVEVWSKGLLDLCEFALNTAQSLCPGQSGLAIAHAHMRDTSERYDWFIASLVRTWNEGNRDPNPSVRHHPITASAEHRRRRVGYLINQTEILSRPSTGPSVRPTDEEIVNWIKSCATENSKEGWQIIHAIPEFHEVRKKDFDHCWKTVWPNRKRGRPKKLLAGWQIVTD